MADVKEAKLAAFRAFDFDGSPEFQAHLQRVELPPNSAAAVAKVQAKWYKREVDPDFELAWVAGAVPAAAQQPQPAAQQAPPRAEQPQAGAREPPPRSEAWRTGRQANIAFLQAAVLVLVLLYLQPLRPALSAWAFGRLMLTLIIVQTLKLHAAAGLPGFNLAAAQAWLARVVPRSDTHHLLLAVAAANNRPMTALLLPFAVRAAYDVAAFLAQPGVCGSAPWWRSHAAPLYARMLAQQQAAQQLCTTSEVCLGFTLLLGLLLPGRAPMFTFMVWQVLRLRFWSADGALYHRQVWASLDSMTAGLRQSFPLLQKVVGFGVNLFHQGRA